MKRNLPAASLKYFLVVACALCLSYTSNAQYTTVTDTGFVSWLKANGYTNCMRNGNELDTVCSTNKTIKSDTIHLSKRGIKDFTAFKYVDWNPSSGYGYLDIASSGLTRFPSEINVLNRATVNLNNNNIDTCILTPSYASAEVVFLQNNGMRYFGSTIVNSEIRELFIDNNKLTSFGPFASGGSDGYLLSIRNNLLTTMPKTGQVTSMDCGNNKITSIAGNNGLWFASSLYIDSNELTTLDLSNFGTYWKIVYHVNCSHNHLTSITGIKFTKMDPYNDNSAGAFNCSDNNLTELPVLPGDVKNLDCHNNPNLKCIPFWPDVPVFTFNFTNTAIQCLPHLRSKTTYLATPDIRSVPECGTFTNPDGCFQYYNLEGYVYSDTNNNCLFDATEKGIDGVKTMFYKNGDLRQQVFTKYNGYYSFDELEVGKYTMQIDTEHLPLTVTCPDTVHYTTTLDTLHPYQSGFNFGMKCKAGFDLGIQTVTSEIIYIGANPRMTIYAGDMSKRFGFNCAAGVGGTLRVTIHGPARYYGSPQGALAPTTADSQAITWQVADFSSIVYPEDAFVFMIRLKEGTRFPAAVCLDVSITPNVAGDNDTSNNHLYYCIPALLGYDPNNKTVYPDGDIDTLTRWLTYNVRFQNTGTGPAQHVIIKDTLDSHVDPSTFQLLASSHKPITQIDKNIITFNFPFINLPDSGTDEPGSHGYVQYKIKLKDHLPIGTQIKNTAYILFDFNDPVVTNTTLNTISTEVATEVKPQFVPAEPELFLYPNPSSKDIYISTKGLVPEQVTVYDAAGRKLTEQKFTSRMDVGSFGPGIYFIEVKDKNTSVRKRFVKL